MPIEQGPRDGPLGATRSGESRETLKPGLQTLTRGYHTSRAVYMGRQAHGSQPRRALFGAEDCFKTPLWRGRCRTTVQAEGTGSTYDANSGSTGGLVFHMGGWGSTLRQRAISHLNQGEFGHTWKISVQIRNQGYLLVPV